ncbi:hypothetical protein B5V03_31370 [Bradyrhizobium betae]|uniref:Uncharacterized protein n=1 Tax=Bradyrhizobium betae TaxID=244734 RepID=A0A4Q1UNT2_9BRAD|nr:hypothetical protein B5V03_31370 [Bradyrhizobium betae]
MTDVSDIQILTPALSMPRRDLLRQEIYKGLADRAALTCGGQSSTVAVIRADYIRIPICGRASFAVSA